MNYREEMKELRDTLNAHGYRYYVLDEPTISDYEYDHMLRRLEELEAAHPEEITPDSPTQRVGGRTLSEFEQVTHPVPLESLQDVFNDDEVCQFLEKIPLDAPVWSVEPKVDGLSVALEYRDGVFVRGATRGDGTTLTLIIAVLLAEIIGETLERAARANGVAPNPARVHMPRKERDK